ncbi:uncharacterized protein LOC132544828 [Ylistrum balloti]|uniref:uncharacterized protein LOC132544828 n=1 Tax=Ylistrum balloti TaxID=509963 RepID=UPI0029059F76|nr:uncharacterized protein LOC132544828 [Ylistrum balloti]
MKGIILFVTVILLSASQIAAYCFYGGQAQQLPGDSQAGQFCVFEPTGKTYDEGETWDTGNCEECECSQFGQYECCGYGMHAGVMNVGDGCDIMKVDCFNGVVIDIDGSGRCKYVGNVINLRGTP